jgi:hypothetical protein
LSKLLGRFPLLLAQLALYLLVLCAKLATVEDLPAWSINMFDPITAEYSHFLSVAGHNSDNGSQYDEHLDHNALLESKTHWWGFLLFDPRMRCIWAAVAPRCSGVTISHIGGIMGGGIMGHALPHPPP